MFLFLLEIVKLFFIPLPEYSILFQSVVAFEEPDYSIDTSGRCKESDT